MNKTYQIILLSFISVLCFTANSLAAQEISQKIIFLNTADLHGKIEPDQRVINFDNAGKQLDVVGGITRIATVIKNIEQAHSFIPVITLSSGDDLLGKYFNYFDGNATFDLMSQAGYDIFSLGNHEFDKGPDVLAKSLKKNGTKALCSDLVTADTAMAGACAPYYIEKIGSASVGFFSLMTEHFSSLTNGNNIRLKDNNLVVAKRMVQLLKEQGADLVVALTHIGVTQDRLLAVNVPGIDIIFAGHSHKLLLDYERVGETILLSAGEKGDALIYLEVSLDQNNKIINDAINFRLIPITEDIVEDDNLKLQLDLYQEQMPAEVVLGTTETVWDLRKTTVRAKESTVADLVNDLIREKFKVDIVFNNSGAFRSNKEFLPGPVTNARLSEIDKFENTIYLLKIKGRYLKEILENSANQVGFGGFMQVSGLRYVVDTGGVAQVLHNQSDNWSVEKAGEKITTIMFESDSGERGELEPDRDYSVACNRFLVDKMGDNYFWFKQYGEEFQDSYLTLYSVLVEAFNQNNTINIPEADGRISFTDRM